MVVIYIVIGFVAGVIIVFLLMRLRQSKLENMNVVLSNENKRQNSEIEKFSTENKILGQENSRLNAKIESNNAAIELLRENFDRERNQLELRRKEAETNAEKLRKESDEQWQLKFEKLKEEIQNTASKIFSEKQDSLQKNNKDQIGEILKPIQQQFDAFRKSVEESKTSNEVAKNELKDAFSATMKLFVQQQNQAVDALKQETARIGNDANNLTNALKRDTKKQGNWGELILESLLEASGLIKDLHYFIQETTVDEEGNYKRPDVRVKFPEGKSVIIDSKVSLTAYTQAFESDDEDIRRKRLKDHAKSVRKHVEELSGKKYDVLHKENIGFVLMFIPNDQCYLAAMEEDPDLSRYAYEKGIVIISPSNLMMALQLAFNMWQQDIRNKNIDKIVKAANELYDKVAGFSDTMKDLDNAFNNVYKKFNTARNQLFEGKGNIMKKVESLKSLGITPKKQITGLDEE